LAAGLNGRLDWAILGPVRLQELRSPQEARFTTLQGSAAYNGWLAGAIGSPSGETRKPAAFRQRVDGGAVAAVVFQNDLWM